MARQTVYPTDDEAKQAILEIGRRMYARGFVAANDGNISCRAGADCIWATPSGVSKGFMEEGSLIKMRLDGTILQSGGLPPSSEIKMHMRIYEKDMRMGGVAHAHPPVCTSFAIAGIPLDREIYPEAMALLGKIPCLPYATPGSMELADAVADCCMAYRGALLSNHGAVAWGESVMEAFFRLEAMEQYAVILMNTEYIIGRAREIDPEQKRKLTGGARNGAV